MKELESLRGDDILDNCPFCGSDLLDRVSTARMLHEAHETLEKLVLAERGSEEFEELLAEVERFVGVG